MASFDKLAEKLIPHYSQFKVAKRLLFTGHSHQAWPDEAFEGLKEAFLTAADQVDYKWSAAFEKTDILRQYLRRFYDDTDGHYGLSQSTHDLIIRWLSSFDLKNKPRIITTDSEFYSIGRQMKRLEEEGMEIVRIPALPLDGFSERFKKAINDQTAAALISHVYFNSSLINEEISDVAEISREFGVPLLIDDYHGTNVVPFSIREHNMEDCYFLIGGYKYLQWGEGNCFLRYPSDCSLRPVITGWFSAFETLDQPQGNNVRYSSGENRFFGATYDPSSQFRAAKVVHFFEENSLNPEILHQDYQQKTAYLKQQFEKLDLNPNYIKLKHQYPIERNGGFIAFTTPKAGEIRAELKKHDIYTDSRSDILRFGPAPYITSSQIDKSMNVLGNITKQLFRE
jgi:kynureninase